MKRIIQFISKDETCETELATKLLLTRFPTISTHLILHDEKEGGQEIRHALDVAKVEVVHDVGHEDVLQQGHVGVILAAVEGLRPVSPPNVLLHLSHSLPKPGEPVLLLLRHGLPLQLHSVKTKAVYSSPKCKPRFWFRFKSHLKYSSTLAFLFVSLTSAGWCHL